MTSQVEAIFENGVLRPLQPMNLSENQKVTLTIDNDGEADVVSHFEVSTDRWQRFCDALDAPPKEIPALRKLLTEKSVLDGNN